MLEHKAEKEVRKLFSNSTDLPGKKFTYNQLWDLPEPVQRYFKYCLNNGQSYISCVRLKHEGTFRTREDHKWLPIKGEQYYTTQKPGFVWLGKVKPLPFLWISARDKYYDGEGNVLVKLFSLLTIGEAKGKETSQASLLRWLGEAVWFPTALLPGDNLRWEAIDSRSARTILWITTSRLMPTFISTMRGTHIVANRYMNTSLEKWTGYCRE